MSEIIKDVEDFYDDMKLRWEWIRKGACYREQIGDRCQLRPLGTVYGVDGEWRVRLFDDPDVTLSLSRMLDEGYHLYHANLFLAHHLHTETDLNQRLRGVYSIPVNDGAGPLNGSNTFRRTFEVPPIQHDAAHRIELLEGLLMEAAGELSVLLLRDVGDLEEEAAKERLTMIETMFTALGYEGAIPAITRNIREAIEEKANKSNPKL